MAVIQIAKAGQYGVVKDRPPEELLVNAWSDSMNMRFREGAAERMLGMRQVFADVPTVTPYWLQSYNQGGKRWWIHAGLTKMFADDGTTRDEITPTAPPTGTIADRYTGGVLNGVLLMNNGVDQPWYWGGTGDLAILPGWPSDVRARSIRPYKNVAVALGITKGVGTTPVQYPHMVKWSDQAVPGAVPSSWDHTDTTKNAGELDLAEEPSEMVDQLTLGDANIIYKENSMWSMVPSGDSQIFRFQRLPGDIGALARGCVANTPMGHVVLTPGDVVLHNGQGPRSIINAVLRRWLFSQIDNTNPNYSFVTTNPVANEVLVFFPSLGATSCDMCAVWNWIDGTWAIRETPNITYGATGQVNYTALQSWDSDTDAWDDDVTAWNQDEFSQAQARLLLCGTAPIILGADTSALLSGVEFTSYVERTGLHFDMPDFVKMIRAIYLRVKSSPGLQIKVEVGASMTAEGEVSWSPARYHTVGTTFKVDFHGSKRGRFLAYRLSSVDNQPYTIDSFGVDVVPMGRF